MAAVSTKAPTVCEMPPVRTEFEVPARTTVWRGTSEGDSAEQCASDVATVDESSETCATLKLAVLTLSARDILYRPVWNGTSRADQPYEEGGPSLV